MPKVSTDNVVIRIHPSTREKLQRVKEHKPAWNIGAVVDAAADALLEREGIPAREPARAGKR